MTWMALLACCWMKLVFPVRHQFSGCNGALPEKCRDGAAYDGREDDRHGDPAAVDEEVQRSIQAMAGPLAEARGWVGNGRGKARRQANANRGSLTGCGCYKSGLAVRADGVITPCTMLSRLSWDGSTTMTSGKLWRNNDALNASGRGILSLFRVFPSAKVVEYIKLLHGQLPGAVLYAGG